jgi:phospholipid/cholesterol/gamma-HCH transport system substrate-binding protein
LALIVLGYLTIKITKERKLLFMRGYELFGVFDDTVGLAVNNSVLMAGVEMGRIKEISLTKEGKAKVTFLVKPEVRISKDAWAYVRSTGLVGTKYLEIKQGEAKEFLEPGGRIVNTTPSPNVDAILSKVADFLEEETEDLKQFIKNMEETSSNIAAISSDIKAGKGSLGKLIKEDELYRRMESLSKRLDNIVVKVEKGEGTLGKLVIDESFYHQANEAIISFNTLLNDIRSGKGSLGRLWTEDAIYLEAKEAVEGLNRIVKKVEKGEGTLGKFISDEGLYEEAKETLRNVSEATSSMRETAPITVIGTAIGVAN